MNIVKPIMLCMLAMVGLAGCSMQAAIQKRYDAQQDDCRTDAEISTMPLAAAAPDQRGAELVNQYTNCMNKAGWKVANPLKPKGAPVTPLPPLDAAKPVAGTALPPSATPIAPANAAALPPTAQPAPVAMPAPAQPTTLPAINAPQGLPVNPNGSNIYYPNAEPTPGRQF